MPLRGGLDGASDLLNTRAEIVEVEGDGCGAGRPSTASHVKVDRLQLVVGASRDSECLAVTRRAAAAGEAFAHRRLRARITQCT